jgi:hypothetical protein
MTKMPSPYLFPKLVLGSEILAVAEAPRSSGIGPSFGLEAWPSRFASDALMCFAGDGGGKGRRKNLLGVDEPLAGDGDTPPGSGLADTPCGYGLGHGLGFEDRAGVFFTVSTLTAPLLPLPDGNGV